MENPKPPPPPPKGQNGGKPGAKPPAKPPAKSPVSAPAPEPIPAHVPPLFRKIDWLTFGVTTLLVFIGYYLTISPNLGLEDSGELAVASMYAGIPHPPGYPVWTLYTWLFTVILPFSNMAWRVAVGSAVAGALSCGLLALLVSRGSSMMMEGIAGLKEISRRWESAICMVTGFVASLLLGFNGYMWSQSVIVEVYSSCVLSLMFVLLGLIRWTYAPHQFRYLYLAFFAYGICINNHQSLLVIALGMEIWVLAVQRKLARQLLFWNTICYLAGLVFGGLGYFTTLTGNPVVFIIYNAIGILSAVGWVWLSVLTKLKSDEIVRDLVLLGVIVCAAISFLSVTGYISRLQKSGAAQFLFAALAVGGAFFFHKLHKQTRALSREWLVALLCGGVFFAGAAFYLYMALAGATNPPMQWGYPRTVEGFFHALTRGQYEKIRPTTGTGDTIGEYVSSLVSTYTRQVWLYLDGTADEFNWAFLLVALIVFVLAWRMQKRERAIVIGMAGIFATLGPFLIFLLNPPPDRQARELIRVFFTASHVLIAMGVGAGLSLVAANLATNYQALRRAAIIGGIIAIDIAIYALAVNTHSLLGEPRVDAAAVEAMRLAASLKWLGGICIFIFMASAGIIAYRIYFSTTDPKPDFPGLICLGVIGFGGLGFGLELLKLKEGQSPGVEFTSLVGFTKAGCWMFGAACLYLAGRADDAVGNRRVPLISGVVASVVSIVLTYVVMRGDTAGFTGLKTFVTALSKAFNPGQYALPVFANLILLVTAVVLTLAFVVWRQRAPLGVLLLAFLVMPLHSIMSHWFENEQRGHLFGYWFGHDMFTPPFTGKDGKFGNYNLEERKELMKDPEKAKFIYPEMTRDAILYGGTDPGRFCPTYMIFCESFTPARCKQDTDPAYDRRDVYIITQNALADGTYLNYIRAHYNKSEQIKYDSPFFQELLRGPKEREQNYSTNFIARSAGTVLDGPLNKVGSAIEARRRREGVYPMKEMYIATPEDSQRCFKEYLDDAQIRLSRGQLKPGEDVKIVDNKVQVSGQVAVMAINGLLTKVMFDKNPTNEFFVEESFPLDWMFPHLTPFGVIMKINRQPLPSLSEEILARDHEFWSRYSERLIGNWITYDTPVKDIVEFAEKTYLRRDFSNYKGDRKFARDDQAQKAFSKLRSSIGGIYTWRLSPDPRTCPPEFRPKTEAEILRIYKEADFTFRQAFAFCPYSPEAVFRYINLLIQPPHPSIAPRLDDALLVAKTCQKLDPNNGQVGDLIRRLEEFKKSAGAAEQARVALAQLQRTVATNPSNFPAVFELATAYMQLQQTDRATALMDATLTNPAITSDVVLAIASFFARSQNWSKLEASLERLVKIAPESPEAWYELARFKGAFGKTADALNAVTQAITLGNKRRATNPGFRDYALEARGDTNFASLRNLPEFQKLITPQ